MQLDKKKIEFKNLKPHVLSDALFVNVAIKDHSTMILGMNTYEINNNELIRP